MRRAIRTGLQAGIDASFASLDRIRARLGTPEVPVDIASWLGRLHTLIGVPFPYLVPDEGMLPPESIRFFRLDPAWVAALLDGAFSLGRNLTAEAGASMNLDAAVRGEVTAASRAAAPKRRRRAALAQPAPAANASTPWNGFLLRSSLVSDYPGLGVNVYPKGHTPEDDDTVILLPVRRLDRLGEKSDTLFCLVEGEPYRVDVHEAPEVLHYGIDRYTAQPGTAPEACKTLRSFTTENGRVTLTGIIPDVPIGDSFRTASPRVMKMTRMAAHVAQAGGVSVVNSAEMGFEMTEGVGKVSFINRGAQ